jgi:hypothetical protein
MLSEWLPIRTKKRNFQPCRGFRGSTSRGSAAQGLASWCQNSSSSAPFRFHMFQQVSNIVVRLPQKPLLVHGVARPICYIVFAEKLQ